MDDDRHGDIRCLVDIGVANALKVAEHRHPCVGDPLYGADPTLSARLGLTRQWLHAHRLGFAHPATGEQVSFEAPYPHDLSAALEILRAGE